MTLYGFALVIIQCFFFKWPIQNVMSCTANLLKTLRRKGADDFIHQGGVLAKVNELVCFFELYRFQVLGSPLISCKYFKLTKNVFLGFKHIKVVFMNEVDICNFKRPYWVNAQLEVPICESHTRNEDRQVKPNVCSW